MNLLKTYGEGKALLGSDNHPTIALNCGFFGESVVRKHLLKGCIPANGGALPTDLTEADAKVSIRKFNAERVFEMTYASDPQILPNKEENQ